MVSHDLIIHKEIVKRVRELGLNIADNPINFVTPVVVLTQSTESEDKTKTFDRNQIEYQLDIWGSENGSSLEIKQIKSNLLNILTQPYNIEGYEIERAKIVNAIIFKEIDGNSSGANNSHFYRCIIYINYQIKEEL